MQKVAEQGCTNVPAYSTSAVTGVHYVISTPTWGLGEPDLRWLYYGLISTFEYVRHRMTTKDVDSTTENYFDES